MKINVSDRISVSILQRSERLAGVRVKCVDKAIAEITYQDIVAECAEIGGGLNYSRRHIERPV